MTKVYFLVIGLRRRVDLLQDYAMPSATTRVQPTPDLGYVITTGIFI